jgi:hypothetical protein
MIKDVYQPVCTLSDIEEKPFTAKHELMNYYATSARKRQSGLEEFGVQRKVLQALSSAIESETSLTIVAFTERDDQGNIVLDANAHSKEMLQNQVTQIVSGVEDQYRVGSQQLLDDFILDQRSKSIFEYCPAEDLKTAIEFTHGIPLKKVSIDVSR